MKPIQPEVPVELDEATCIFGAGVLLKHLQSLSEEVKGVRSGEADIEFIHRARVASRRLRAALPLFQDCLPQKKSQEWLKRLKKVTRALGEARDTDVQLERLEAFAQAVTDKKEKPGINRLLLRWQQRRESLQEPVTTAMDRLIQQGTLEEMHDRLKPLAGRQDQVYLYTPTLYQHSFQAIHSRLEEFLSYQAVVDQPEKVDELHQMRIAAKWLRYTMETFSPLYMNELKPYIQTTKKVQDMLGEIHDCDVWLQTLPRFLDEERARTCSYFGNQRSFSRLVPGIQAFERDRQQARSDLFQKFQDEWQAWQGKAIWSELQQSIQVPFFQHEDPGSPAPDQPQQDQHTPSLP